MSYVYASTLGAEEKKLGFGAEIMVGLLASLGPIFGEKLSRLRDRLTTPEDVAVVDKLIAGVKPSISEVRGLVKNNMALVATAVADLVAARKAKKEANKSASSLFVAPSGEGIMSKSFAGMPMWGWLAAGGVVIAGAVVMAKKKGTA